jgi:translation initiation factor 2 subunit 2
MANDYEKLLNEAYSKIKPISHSGERFEIPKIEGHFEGTKTILTNIPQIVSYLRRNQEHLIKFLLKELATSGTFRNSVLILQRKIPSLKINEKIQQYSEEFVICRECKKPDTELIKEKGFLFMHCLACGAKHPVRVKI